MKWINFLVLASIAALFIYVSADLPDWGDPNAPGTVHLPADFIEQTESDIGIPNIVAAILADFRSFDTLGEVVVVFTGGISVFLILGRGKRQRE
ncbi:MAG: hydrogen gas-evolving membrane-bound hydrogenase subunit E [Dehalococcoidia bacterium]